MTYRATSHQMGWAGPPLPTRNEGHVHVLDQDWSAAYMHSDAWGGIWKQTQDVSVPWPPGVKVWGNKMYWAERLCVPEPYCEKCVAAHHQTKGHVGVERLIRELRHR